MKPTTVNYLRLFWHTIWKFHRQIEWLENPRTTKVKSIYCADCEFGREPNDKK